MKLEIINIPTIQEWYDEQNQEYEEYLQESNNNRSRLRPSVYENKERNSSYFYENDSELEMQRLRKYLLEQLEIEENQEVANLDEYSQTQRFQKSTTASKNMNNKNNFKSFGILTRKFKDTAAKQKDYALNKKPISGKRIISFDSDDDAGKGRNVFADKINKQVNSKADMRNNPFINRKLDKKEGVNKEITDKMDVKSAIAKVDLDRTKGRDYVKKNLSRHAAYNVLNK